MTFQIDQQGNITLIQGDSGTLAIHGLNTDKNYQIYLAIQDKNRKPVGNELCVNSNKSPSIIFELTGNFTDIMTVPKNELYETYYYGIKQCSENGYENTLVIGDNEIGYQNTITVYPKKVEGT